MTAQITTGNKLRQGQHIEHAGSRGTVARVTADGWIKVTWPQERRGTPRLKVWYPPEIAAMFLAQAGRDQ